MQKSLSRQDVEEIIQVVTKRQFGEVNQKLTKVDQKLDKIMTTLDRVAGELQDMRDEQTLHQGQHDELFEQLENHDTRLNKLEHPTL